MKRRMISYVLALGLLLGTVGVSAEEAKEDAESPGDLRAAVQNPISSLISLPFKFNFDYGAPNGEASFLNIQPVVPVTAGKLNLVNRLILPVIDNPGQVAGTPPIPNPIPGNGATGLGDANYTLFFSPAEYTDWIWGAGPSLTAPTATDDQLGSGKWSAGPSLVALTQPSWGTWGGLVRQLWSFAGDSDRAGVSQLLLEPFVNYNLSNGWYLISDMVIVADWNAPSGNQWTVPLGGGAGKLFTVGKQAMNVRAEAYYNVVTPDAGPSWQWGFSVQLLFPK